MKKRAKQLTALSMAVVLGASALSGCGAKKGAEETSASGQAVSSQESGSEEKVKLKVYSKSYGMGVLENMGQCAAYEEYAARNNVEIEWVHPIDGSDENEQLNLLLASGNLPDIIFWNWNSVPGNIGKYVGQKLFIDLSEYTDYIPDYLAALEANPDCKRAAYLDDGTLPAFYMLESDVKRTLSIGCMLRQDWLDKLNLEVPTTIDEWHTVLTAFRDGDPNGNGEADEIPFTFLANYDMDYFATAWRVTNEMCLNPDTGKVQYGPITDEFREYLTTMNQWYQEGLIDSEYPTNDKKMQTAKITGDIAGGTVFMIGGGMGTWTTAARQNNPEFELVGVTNPISTDGIAYMSKNNTTIKTDSGAVISSKCKNIEAALKLLNYGYTEEGDTLLNWGEEGVSFNVVDGKKVLCDDILYNPEGLSRTNASVKYSMPSNGWAKKMSFDAWIQIQSQYPEQTQAIENWYAASNALTIPYNVIMTTDESSEYSQLYNEISTYSSEMILKFIMGTEPLENFDKFVSAIKGMGVDRAIEIKQAAYDRYMSK